MTRVLMPDTNWLQATQDWFEPGRGPRYQQLHRHIAEAITSGRLNADEQLPPERELAESVEVSRVTVRKAIAQLVSDGLIEQRRGAGSFVRAATPRLQQSLSSLVSFSENMQARGMQASSEVLFADLCTPTTTELMALGLSANDKVARIHRIRSADDCPMAVESSSIPQDILPNPRAVTSSLYAVLRQSGLAPTRAVQRVTATNLSPDDATKLRMPEGAAVLKIERTGYLDTGRPIEFTSGLYRSDHYDFVSELRPG